MKTPYKEVFSIGHSNLSYRAFAALLRKTGVEQVVDVRSRPYSTYVKHFNYDVLKRKLGQSGIDYLYLGNQLGSQNLKTRALVNSEFQYRGQHAEAAFEDGIQQLLACLRLRKVAVMCVEADPYACHRHTVLAPELEKRGITMRHIFKSGLVSNAYDQTVEAFNESSNWIQRTLFDDQTVEAGSNDPFDQVA